MDQMILCAIAMMALRWWTSVAFYRPIGVLHEGSLLTRLSMPG